MSKKFCYLFTEGNAKMRELLGGKGANLAEMTNIGLPVPQGFTITTEACTQYYEDGRQINDEIMAEIMEYIEKMEKITGKKFGDHENPLLVSVRTGALAARARLSRAAGAARRLFALKTKHRVFHFEILTFMIRVLAFVAIL